MNDFILEILKNHLAPSIDLISSKSVSGGCINSTYKIETNQGKFFLKWNKESLSEMFRVEELGLSILKEKSSIITPKSIASGTLDNHSYLLTEWIEKGSPSTLFWENFGANLAAQHKVPATEYGLDHDNYIGSLPQSNRFHKTWPEFFISERLSPQLELAQTNKLIDSKIQSQFDQLFKKLATLVPEESPSLLHGDLWSGNFMTHASGEAAIFDPAVHFGHRETELAFTQLFGGFSPTFYESYESSYPLEPGFDERVDIHNLYPLLVHVNLFGRSYLAGIIQTLNRFI